jgi:hypothetical protein
MHDRINSAQAQALARLIHELHPTWDIPGIAAAISKAKDRASNTDLCIAAIRLTTRDDLRTPGVLADDGPHWRNPTNPATDHRYTRCPEPGHTSFPAWNCSACRSEALEAPEAEPLEPTDRLTPYDTGPALVRAELARAKTTPTGRN